MINISPFVQVGVSVPALCDFYSKIYEYIFELEQEIGIETDYELIQLSIYGDKSKLSVEYLLLNTVEDQYYKIESNSTLTEMFWTKLEPCNDNDIFSGNLQITDIYDVDHYLKNN